MLGTLPGRTFGLALLTEPVLAEFELTRTRYGLINLVTAFFGAGFAIVAGWLIDRFDLRTVSVAVLLCLGLSTFAFAKIHGVAFLVLALLAARGFGQSALSLTSLALVGKWFARGLGPAMGVFSVLVSVFFAAALSGLPGIVATAGWRPVWSVLGLILLAFAGVAAVVVRNPPAEAPLEKNGSGATSADEEALAILSLKEAIRTPIYWAFTLGSALFNLVVAGVLFFNESILANELALGEDAFAKVMGVFFLAGLVGSLLAGWAVQHFRMGRVLSISLLTMCACLLLLPKLGTQSQAMLHAVPFGMAGAVIPVVYFSGYAKAFGRRHLGKIQGSAQLAACFASASGPLLLGWSKDSLGTYWPPLTVLALLLGVIGLGAWFVRRPRGVLPTS